MIIRSLKDCNEIIAGDNTKLREIFNPIKDKELELGYSLAYAEVLPNEITHLHSLKSSEVYYILSGTGEMYLGDEVSKVESGDTVCIPKNTTQQIKNIGSSTLSFLCIVDPAWKSEDEIIHTS